MAALSPASAGKPVLRPSLHVSSPTLPSKRCTCFQSRTAAGSAHTTACFKVLPRDMRQLRRLEQGCRAVATRATQIEDLAAAHHREGGHAAPSALICAPITADALERAQQEIEEAKSAGAEVVELRLDFLQDLDLADPGPPIMRLLSACRSAGLPAIVTMRPKWEGGKYDGDEAVRLAILKFASTLQPAYIDVELLAADFFFAGSGTVPIGTNVILSHHDYDTTPNDAELDKLVQKMFESGADIAKVATMATDISDSMRMLSLPGRCEGPVIALAMGEKGLASRLLASKYGSHLTFGSLSTGRGSAPGQPTVNDLHSLYRLSQQRPSTQVFGVVGNPVSHSRSPTLHNAALAASGLDAVYIPLLVDSMPSFLDSFNHPDFKGFSVTIPHKLAALEAADQVDPVAQQIGAVNTLIRQPDGTLKGYNTDWSAAIEAIEASLQASPSPEADPDCDEEGCSLDFGDSWSEEQPEAGPSGSRSESPLKGQRVVVVGAGGAGRALAFGAASRGAHVIVTNRSRQRAEDLVAALGREAEVADLEAVASGSVSGDVLVNSSSVGMQPNLDSTPVPSSALSAFRLVFDAVYTPVETRLLKEAQAAGCLTVSGLEMFIGQAAQQYRLFTGQAPPIEVMREAVVKSIK